MGEGALYAYGLLRADASSAATVAGLTGIGGRPVRLVTHGAVAAAVGEVDLDEFGEDALARHLEDLAWLERVATAHDTVVGALAATTAVAPLRLTTVFLSEDGLRERLAQWEGTALAVLARLGSAREWSVKVYVDEPGPQQPPSASGTGDGGGSGGSSGGGGAGAAYLRRRRDAVQQQDRALERGQEVADAVDARLVGIARAGRRLTPQDRRLTGHTGDMVLNGAYLVDDADAAAFADSVAELGREHRVRTELAGPWAPYSFATLEDA